MKRLLLSIIACVTLFGAASYLPTATQKTFAPEDAAPVVESADSVESAPAVNRLAASYTEPDPQRDERKATVYVTRTGAKYHSGSCQHLRRSKIPISLKEAKAQGYDACKVCRPPR